MINDNNIISVSELNKILKGVIEKSPYSSYVLVRGEISNLTYHKSGHIYFTLKDVDDLKGKTYSIPGVMYKFYVPSGLSFKMKAGDKVVVTGKISLYEVEGKVQLIATKITLDGIGEIYKKLEELKKELKGLGWFDLSIKKEIPYYVKKIGIVTAPTGEAINDIVSNAKRRNPYISLILYPAKVQGEKSVESIVKGIEVLNKTDCDAIIVGRGGGSIEDLWAFNDRKVAEAIFNSNKLIVSAVGHEGDHTISDLVADICVSTPTKAAEVLVRNIDEIFDRIELDRSNLLKRIQISLNNKKMQLSVYHSKVQKQSPENKMKLYKSRLYRMIDNVSNLILNKVKDSTNNYLDKKISLYNLINLKLKDAKNVCESQKTIISNLSDAKINRDKHKLELYVNKLYLSSPLKKISSGYAYPEDEKGKHILHAKDVKVGDKVSFTFEDGKLYTKVKDIKYIDYNLKGESNLDVK